MKSALRRAVVLTVGIVLIENLVTWFLPDPYTALFNAGAVTLLILVARSERLGRDDLGLTLRGTYRSLIPGTILSLHVATLVFLVALAQPAAFEDVKVPEDGGALLGELLRVLVVTAAAEEFIFRGALFSLWRRLVPVRGTGWRRSLRWLGPSLITGCAFGLWHIGPTHDTLVCIDGSITVGPFVAAVATTAISGAFVFGFIREHTEGLAGGILLHFVVNGSVIAAAYGIVHWFS